MTFFAESSVRISNSEEWLVGPKIVKLTRTVVLVRSESIFASFLHSTHLAKIKIQSVIKSWPKLAPH